MSTSALSIQPSAISVGRNDYFDSEGAYLHLRAASQFRHCWLMAKLHGCPVKHRAYLRARMRESALAATAAARSHARRRIAAA